MTGRVARRAIGTLCVVIAVVGGASFASGPALEWAVRKAAERRHVELAVGRAHLGWFKATLDNAHVRLVGVPSLEFVASQVSVPFTASLQPTELLLRNGSLTLTGGVKEVVAQLARWRSLSDAERVHAEQSSARQVVPVHADFALHWVPAEAAPPIVEARAVELSRGALETTVSGRGVSVAYEGVQVDTPELSLQLDSALKVRSFEVPRTDIVVGREFATTADVPGELPAKELERAGTESREERAVAMLRHLFSQMAEGGTARVSSLSFSVDRPLGALRFGEGSFSAERKDDVAKASYTSGRDGKALSVSVTVPIEKGDVHLDVEAGAVSLASLGVVDGAFGLTDVGRTKITGRGALVFGATAPAIAFDGALDATNVSVSAPRLAKDPVTGLNLRLAARGAVEGEGKVRVDTATVALGAIRVTGGGTIDRTPTHLSLVLHAAAAPIECSDLLASIPPALIPTLDGVDVKGSWSANAKLSVDSDKLDSLVLESDVKDGCEATVVPSDLARERFEVPFTHRIYQADGGIGEERTGPGTELWTPLEQVSPYMQVAVRTTEDGGFPRHHGWSGAAMRGALIANLKAGRFVRGASTISMQLAKNLFLTRDKTLARKLEELILTDYLEKTFTKRELMELYLNIVEFGPDVYGVTAAAQYYFGRTPAELTLTESMFLSTMLPSPLRLSAVRKAGTLPEPAWKSVLSLIKTARRVGLISETEEREAANEPVVFAQDGVKPAPRPPVRRPPDAPVLDHGEQADLERESAIPLTPPPPLPAR